MNSMPAYKKICRASDNLLVNISKVTTFVRLLLLNLPVHSELVSFPDIARPKNFKKYCIP